jgi:hypothetical protein
MPCRVPGGGARPGRGFRHAALESAMKDKAMKVTIEYCTA